MIHVLPPENTLHFLIKNVLTIILFLAFIIQLFCLKKFENGVKVAFELPYSNGIIEGTNNLIKVIKRVAYGYRNFEFMRIRIKIITGYCFS